MITDTERLIDGFRGLPAGMDGSKEPPQTPSEAAWYATNVTFRGGNGPRTRPGFREIPPTYWRNPQPVKSVSSITINSGVATVTTSGNHEYDNKDKVTIAGASPAGVNGTFTVTVTGSTTFTYPTTATGTVTGTITSRRDIDSTYSEDFIDGKTSRTRYTLDVVGATYVQGVAIYQDPREGNPTQMIVVVDGKIMALDFNEASVKRLNLSDEISTDVPVYMTQAEKYLIIQTGQDEPRIYDGYTVRRVSYYGSRVVPIGKQMAYGQGRLYVAINEGAEIIAGDLVFGGSLTESKIVSSSAASLSVITTASPHGLSSGDLVSISGNSSVIDSTYVATVTAATTFTIPVDVSTAGTGGTVTRFNAGQDSDLLLFTETTFLNEGGALAPNGKVGRITGLVFLPVQDTATGQGDLIAFCERGAVTFQVSAPRDQWKNIVGFQRILFDNIGSTSESILPVNGDLFFRSREGNGIRTYRNARAEVGTYGQTPVSAEIDPVLQQDTQWMLDQVSMVNFDNRLLMTCFPRRFPRRATDQTQADLYASQPVPTLYEGISVLDFQSSSAGRGKTAAVFDGVWTGLRIVKLVQGTFDGDPRCFAVCSHEDATGRRVEIWEVTKNDEFDTPVEGKRRINAGIVTKAFNLGDQMSLKKLIRCDLWFDDLGGGSDYPFECELAYRPDDYPNFTTWQRFQREFKTDFLLSDDVIVSPDYTADFENWNLSGIKAFGSGSVLNETTSPEGFTTADRLVASGTTQARLSYQATVRSGRVHSFSVYAKHINNPSIQLSFEGVATDQPAVWFNVQTGEVIQSQNGATGSVTDAGSGWYRLTISARTEGAATATTQISLTPSEGSVAPVAENQAVHLWGATLVSGEVDAPDEPEAFNRTRGYAPQVKFPAPPRTANIATNVPAYLGHDFTLRVNWTGRAHLGRLMLHGNRLIESVGGGSL